ncbi:hypothetical protein HK099_007349, partial [Clydaea vesicula]
MLIGDIPGNRQRDLTILSVEQEKEEMRYATNFNKKLHNALREANLSSSLPIIIKDCLNLVGKWKIAGEINPFDELEHMVFIATCRTLGGIDMIQNSRAIHKYLSMIESNSGGFFSLFPYLPTTGKIKMYYAFFKLHRTLSTFIQDRRSKKTHFDDNLQTLIESPDMTDHDIFIWLATTLRVSISTTGAALSWTICYIHKHLEYRKYLLDGLKRIVAEQLYEGDEKKIINLTEDLTKLPLTVWENNFKFLDNIFNEALRLTSVGNTIRRVIKPVEIDGHDLPLGSFVLFSQSNNHLNPETFENPDEFNPRRWETLDFKSLTKEYKNTSFGTGRHPCLGQRLARLNVKLLISVLVTNFEFELVGNLVRNLDCLGVMYPKYPVKLSYHK